MGACGVPQEALPNATVKAVKAVNAVYQNVDLSRLMDRVLALSRNNILGAFPGTNPFGFQAWLPSWIYAASAWLWGHERT